MRTPRIFRIMVLLGLSITMIGVAAEDDEFHITPEDLELNTGGAENKEENVIKLEENDEEEDTEPSEVVVLVEDPNDPDALTEELANGIWLVEFYSPNPDNCSLCSELAPIWEKVAKLAKKKELRNFHVASLDIEEYPFARMFHRIGRLPTIKLFRDGTNYTMPQPGDLRTPKQYIKYATKTFKKEQKQLEERQKEQAEREAKKIKENDLTSKVVRLTPKDFSMVMKGNWLIDFYGARCERCKKLDPKWEKVAFYVNLRKINLKVARFDATQPGGTEISKSFEANPWPKIFLVKDGVTYPHPDSMNFAWDVEDYVDWAVDGYLDESGPKFTPTVFSKFDKRAARKAKYGKRKKKKVIKGRKDPEDQESVEDDHEKNKLVQDKKEEIGHDEL